MLIRVAEEHDLQGIGALLFRSYSVLMRPAYDVDVLEAALPAISKAKPDLVALRTFYVAELDGEIIGCGGWTWSPPGKGKLVDGLVHARHFAVDPQHTGRGVGRAIFGRCATDARAAGALWIQALSSLNAAEFYRKVGLTPLQPVSVTLGGATDFPVILMEGDIGKPTLADRFARVNGSIL
jgi:N-acetylglutamate synthase-like GNAT family acetyltransferase